MAGVEAYLHAEFDLDPSNRLAQYTNVTDRQADRTDRQRIDSIGRTVFTKFSGRSKIVHCIIPEVAVNSVAAWRMKINHTSNVKRHYLGVSVLPTTSGSW